MQISQKYGLVYVITKLGLFVCIRLRNCCSSL
ncbi:hypothetical protein BRADI_4g44980v3 [Brachypodium distachyon]|uniref:Uncharacterized protein n=2 Tax=Brachypodium distachyon TaxID=15368 RepID=A0A0Q3HGL9_BRADI|nr:hypothetical protein BRADI_4g44980v3 [Brachypodium distachyon]